MTAISAASATESHETANPFPALAEIGGTDVAPSLPRGPVAPRPSRPCAHDSSRTCFESRIAFGAADADEEDPAEEIPTATRRFSVLETTSGLPDDSREADENAAERRLRELRSRVKVTRAVVASTPGLAGLLEANWRKAALFYARFGITEAQFRHDVAAGQEAEDAIDSVLAPCPDIEGRRARVSATFPISSTQPAFP